MLSCWSVEVVLMEIGVSPWSALRLLLYTAFRILTLHGIVDVILPNGWKVRVSKCVKIDKYQVGNHSHCGYSGDRVLVSPSSLEEESVDRSPPFRKYRGYFPAAGKNVDHLPSRWQNLNDLVF